MMPIRTILHPTDFSPCSARAFELACELAKDSGARLVTLHVKPLPTTIPESNAGARQLDDPDTETFVEDVELSRGLDAFARSDPYLRIERRIESGDPASEILRVVNELSADLIVMGTHGVAASDRTLIGNVARRVLTGARCAVITITPPLRDQDESTHRSLREEGRPDEDPEGSLITPLPHHPVPAWVDHPAA